jgi:hypothetical protein
MNLRSIVLVVTLVIPWPATAQILIPPTSKEAFTRTALEDSGKRSDPFAKVNAAKPIVVAPPPPPSFSKKDLVKPIEVPVTPIASSLTLKGFMITPTEGLALVSRDGNTDIARVGDTILSAQVVAISPVAKTITFKENGKYVVRSLEEAQ